MGGQYQEPSCRIRDANRDLWMAHFQGSQSHCEVPLGERLAQWNRTSRRHPASRCSRSGAQFSLCITTPQSPIQISWERRSSHRQILCLLLQPSHRSLTLRVSYCHFQLSLCLVYALGRQVLLRHRLRLEPLPRLCHPETRFSISTQCPHQRPSWSIPACQ